MLQYAIIGFGGIGKCHFSKTEEVYQNACTDVKLIALCDINPEAFITKTDTNLGDDNSSKELADYRLYTDVDELLANETLDFVILALPTYLHAEMAVKVMERGIHVFSEKPMALSLKEAQSMIDASHKNGVKLMIGQCCRYSGRYNAAKDIIESKKYGKVLRVDMYRLSQTPIWSWKNWFLDAEKSGGSALDLHVHDVDILNYYFGMPKAVTSRATHFKSGYDSITTIYDYDDMVVTETGEWGCPTSYGFRSGLFIKMERATLETRDGKLMLFTEDEAEGKIITREAINDYAAEIVDFISCIVNNKESAINPPEASMDSIRIALAEKESADTCATVML